jgi:hypothetical protein
VEPPTEIRRTFRDPALQQEFTETGFTVIDLVPPEEAAALAERFVALYAGSTEGFHSSLESPDHAYRDRLHDELVRTFGHLLDDWFDDHDLVMAAATVKWSGGDSTVEIHQDWSFVDESRFRTVNLWIPLVETFDDNGGLYVLPGSHVEHRKLRVHGGFPSWYHDPAWLLEPDSFEAVRVRPGQAIVTDHALLHRSPPNVSDDARIAMVIVMKPVEATLHHWYLADDDRIIRYTIGDISFFRRIVALQDPADLFEGLESEVVEFDRPRPPAEAVPPAGAAAAREPAPTPAGEVVAEVADQHAAAAAPCADAAPGSGALAAGARRKSLWRHLRRRAVAVPGER